MSTRYRPSVESLEERNVPSTIYLNFNEEDLAGTFRETSDRARQLVLDFHPDPVQSPAPRLTPQLRRIRHTNPRRFRVLWNRLVAQSQNYTISGKIDREDVRAFLGFVVSRVQEMTGLPVTTTTDGDPVQLWGRGENFVSWIGNAESAPGFVASYPGLALAHGGTPENPTAGSSWILLDRLLGIALRAHEVGGTRDETTSFFGRSVAEMVAHEIGHCAGLEHTDLPDNLMSSNRTGGEIRFEAWQLGILQNSAARPKVFIHENEFYYPEEYDV